jgi:hypothetical protein
MSHLFSALVLLALGVGSAVAQPALSWSGRMFLDYTQPLHAHDEDAYGAFALRRLYLTADAAMGSAFSGRARLELNENTRTEEGLPSPFVKDLYVRWNVGRGHNLTFGIQPTPAFRVAQDAWGYRSLARTLANAAGAISSRDFGLAVRGPVVGPIRYALMVGNNEGVRVENDDDKRVYGQLQWLPDPFALTLHADYATYDDEREDAATVSAFAGVTTERFRLGTETFWQRTRLRTDTQDLRGIGVFAVVALTPRLDLVARSHWEDHPSFVEPFPEEDDHPMGPAFLLAAVSYEPTEGVQLIPNVFWEDPADGPNLVVGRFTLFASF